MRVVVVQWLQGAVFALRIDLRQILFGKEDRKALGFLFAPCDQFGIAHIAIAVKRHVDGCIGEGARLAFRAEACWERGVFRLAEDGQR